VNQHHFRATGNTNNDRAIDGKAFTGNAAGTGDQVPSWRDFHEDDFELRTLNGTTKVRSSLRAGMFPKNSTGYLDVTQWVAFWVRGYEKKDASHTQLTITSVFQPADYSNVKFIFFIPVTCGGGGRQDCSSADDRKHCHLFWPSDFRRGVEKQGPDTDAQSGLGIAYHTYTDCGTYLL
jgi:hypothetical protein